MVNQTTRQRTEEKIVSTRLEKNDRGLFNQDSGMMFRAVYTV